MKGRNDCSVDFFMIRCVCLFYVRNMEILSLLFGDFMVSRGHICPEFYVTSC